MSAGNPIIRLRVNKELKQRITDAIDSANRRENKSTTAYDLSAWIRKAILEKLSHLERSNKKKNNPQIAIDTPTAIE